MHKTKNGWNIYEVKSSSSIKSYHEYDASIQWHVLKNLKIVDINEVFIATLNNKYLKQKAIDPTEFFNIQPVTQIAKENRSEIEKKIRELKEIAAMQNEPKINIGAHCKKPHSCKYFNKCWPENIDDIDSVFKFYRLNLSKKLKLYEKGIDTFAKVKDIDSLSSIQKLQIEAYKTNAPVINKDKISNFINKVKYPISYFDFETFTDAVPIYDKQRPHMQMPFQYSLHIQRNEKEKLNINDNHFEFIADHDQDPRRALAESIITNFPKEGTIMAYNESFEKNCIKTLASHCPDLEEDLLKLNERFLDLIEPFRGGGYYDPKFKGKFSIKNVLPAVCPNNPELDYSELEISNGGMAMNAYKQMRDNQSKCDYKINRNELFKYCRLDTYAMYAIFKKLQNL